MRTTCPHTGRAPSRRPIAALLVATVAAPLATASQEETPTESPSRPDPSAVVHELAEQIAERYVDEALGAKCGELLRAALDDDVLTLDRPELLAEQLTKILRDSTSDLHLTVSWSDPANAIEDPEPGDDWWSGGRVSNHGFKKVERLTGNVGLLEFTAFWQPEDAGRAANAAMQLLRHSDAVIIDLREKSGGSSEMVKLMASWLLPPRTPLAGIHWRGNEQPDQAWSEAWIDAPRLADVPAFVLTSADTFSAAEALAYDLQVVGRAQVVGAKTRGGAHPGGSFDLADGFSVWIPTGRAVHPKTGSNWEGVGVTPDVVTAPEDALTRAHMLALEAIRERTDVAAWRRQLSWQIDWLDARRTDRPIDDALRAEVAGDYGFEKVRDDGRHLWCHREGAPPWRMFPDGEGAYRVDGRWDYRITFDRADSGAVTALRGTYASGREFVRERR